MEATSLDEVFPLLPDLEPEEYEALKLGIQEHGVQHKIIFDADGNVVDGHFRLRACEELGITDYPKDVETFADETERYKFVLAVNLQRRHLNSYQRVQIVHRIKADYPDWSVREIAKLTASPSRTFTATSLRRLTSNH
jgi:ParB-like chromosome segregation protein Spo0J